MPRSDLPANPRPIAPGEAPRLPARVVAALFAGVVLWSGHAAFVLGDASVYAEDGPLESLQAALLALACAGFLSPRVAPAHERAMTLLCALLCFAFLLRELDVERFDVPGWVKRFGGGDGRDAMLAAGLVAWIGYAARHFARMRRAAASFLASPTGIRFVAAAPLLLAGRLFETSESLPHHAWWEEIAELAADGLILLAAWSAGRRGAAAAPDGARQPSPGAGARR